MNNIFFSHMFSHSPCTIDLFSMGAPCTQEKPASLFEYPSLTIEPLTIAELNASLQKLRIFGKGLGMLPETPIRQDVLRHCDKVKDPKKEELSFTKVEILAKNRIQKMIKNKKMKRNWGNDDIDILIWVVSKFAEKRNLSNVETDLTQLHWTQIAQLIPGVTADICMFKWLSLKKNRLFENCWSEKQSLLLDRLVAKHGEDDWNLISELLYKFNDSENRIFRCSKQCRQHWNCYLSPNLKKGPWELQEDITLLTEIVKQNGKKKWTILAKFLNGRTENALKNRYNLLLEKQRCCYNLSEPLEQNEQIFLITSYLNQISAKDTKEYSEGLAVNREKEEEIQDHKRKMHMRRKIRKQKNDQYEIKNYKKKKSIQLDCLESSLRIHEGFDKSRYFRHSPKLQQNHIIKLNYQDLGQQPHRQPHTQSPQCTPVWVVSPQPESMPAEPTQAQIPSHPEASKEMEGERERERGETCQNWKLKQDNDDNAIKIIAMQNNENMFEKLKQIINKSERKICSFVPCVISDNKLTKIQYD